MTAIYLLGAMVGFILTYRKVRFEVKLTSDLLGIPVMGFVGSWLTVVVLMFIYTYEYLNKKNVWSTAINDIIGVLDILAFGERK